MDRNTISVKTCSVAGSILVAFVSVCRADVVQLTSGQEIHTTVARYKNNAFEVRGDDGKTASFPANNVKRIQFESRSASAKIMSRTHGAQEGNVLVYENGAFSVAGPNGPRNFPAIFVDQIDFVAGRGLEIEVITGGQQVDLAKHLALGNVTIIDFYADWCGPCKRISPLLEQLTKSDPEIALRKIDIINWQSPVVKQYNLHAIPHVQIYNRKGQLIGTVTGLDPERVQQYVAKAKSG
jgi:thiol-disulfide isomerase/thioredoxin